MKPQHRRPRPGRLAALAAAALLLVALPTARADLTGYTVLPISGGGNYPTGPQYIAMEPWMTQTGWDIQQVGIFYNRTTDTLLVDIKAMVNPLTGAPTTVGDADGLGLQGQNDPQLAAAGGYNPANLGGLGSVSMAFASATAGHALDSPVAIAGVPEFKSANAPNDGFQLSQYTGSPSLQTAYGDPITTSTGTLLGGGPSASVPDFVFTISNFSKLPGMSLANGFYFSLYAGSPNDVVAGEDTIPWTYVTGFNPSPQLTNQSPPPSILPPGIPEQSPSPQLVPEPSSFALCGVGVIGFWMASRRRRARAN